MFIMNRFIVSQKNPQYKSYLKKMRPHHGMSKELFPD